MNSQHFNILVNEEIVGNFLKRVLKKRVGRVPKDLSRRMLKSVHNLVPKIHSLSNSTKIQKL